MMPAKMNQFKIISLILLVGLPACAGDDGKTTRENQLPLAEQSVEAPQVDKTWPPLPEYIVHRRNPYWKGGQQGHIIVPKGKELSRDSLIQALRLITEKENFTLCRFYIDTDAYQANVSVSFSSAHPGALELGFLGMVEEGKYTNSYD